MFWNNYKYKIENNEVILLEYTGEEERVCIPAEIDGCPVTKIGAEAFSGRGFGIEQIEVPGTVKIIGDYAFKMCMSLTELTLHEGLLEIGKGILDVTSMTKIHIPATVRIIKGPYDLGDFSWEIDESNPFYHTDGYALYYTQEFSKIQVLEAVQKKDRRPEYEVEDGTDQIGQNAFEGQMYLQKVILPESVAVIGDDAFESCQNLQEIVLPEGLQVIGADAFRHCVNLRELRIPASLRVLGERALTDTFGWSDRMNGIVRITAALENPVFKTDENALYRKEENGTVTLIKYFGRERKFVIPAEVFQVGESAFRRSNVRKLVLLGSLSVIQKDAFRECKNLESVWIEADQVLLYVPRTPVYRKDEVTALFYGQKRPYIYDYTKYDKLAETWSQITERCRMACFRLKYPMKLDTQIGQKYMDLIQGNMREVLTDICDREDSKYLAELAEIGIFTSGNIDEAIDVINGCQKAKLTGYLMNYKQEHLGISEFDFSL